MRASKTRVTVAVTVTTALGLTGCAATSTTQLTEITDNLDLPSTTLLASDSYGHERRIEGDPPTQVFLYQDSPRLRDALEKRLTKAGFALSSPSYWSMSLNDDDTAWARFEKFEPEATYTSPISGAETPLPASGGLLMAVYVD